MTYYGVFFNSETKKRLLEDFKFLIPEGWITYADHCTIIHKSDKDFCKVIDYISNFLYKRVSMNIIGFGVSGNAIALEVDFMTQNLHSHVTLAVKPGHLPVESNMITMWYKYPKSRTVVGTIDRK